MDRERLMDLVWHVNAQLVAQREGVLLARSLGEKMKQSLPELLHIACSGSDAARMLRNELLGARSFWEETVRALSALIDEVRRFEAEGREHCEK